jgi:CRP-like cAMP-binding protein/HEAT repeat protein
MSTRLTRLFAIRPGDETKTLLLFSLHFVFYVGLRWGENASETLFINAWGADALSGIFIANAVLSFAMALVFTALADRMSNARLLAGMAGVMIVWLASVWWLFSVAGGANGPVYPYFYLVYTAFGEAATLNIINYINDFYDTRTAKQALPLMLSGALAGSTFAGFTAPLLNQTIGLWNVPLAWMACLFIVIGLLYVCRRKLVTISALAAQATKGAQRTSRATMKSDEGMLANLRAGLTFVRESSFLRWLALVTFTGTLLVRFLTFQANVVFAEQFRGDPTSLSNFYGIVSGAANVVGLLIQSLLLGRLVTRFGVGALNMTFPSLTLLAVGALNVAPTLATAIFGRIDHTMFKQVLRNPLDAMLLNGVPIKIKGRARGFLKLVAPIGTLTAGVLLTVVQQDSAPVWALSVLALALAVFYVVASVSVNREYTRSLTTLLAEDAFNIFRANQDSDQSAFERPAPETLAQLQKRMRESESDEMAVFMAEMVYEIQGRDALPHLQELYRLRGPKVRASLIQRLGDEGLINPLVRRLGLAAAEEPEAIVRQAAAQALARTPLVEHDSQTLGACVKLLNDSEETIQAIIIPTLLASGQANYIAPAQHKLAQWLAPHSDEQHRMLGLRVLSQTGDARLLERLAEYLADPTPSVRREAADLLGELMARTKDATIQQQGIDVLRTLLHDPDEAVRLAAINSIGHLHSVEANLALLTALSDPSFTVRRQVCAVIEPNIKTELEQTMDGDEPYSVECAAFLLARTGHTRARRRVLDLMENLLCETYTTQAQRLPFEELDATSVRVLRTTLQELAIVSLDRLFWLLSALSNEADAQAVLRSLRSDDPHTRANAIESLETMATPQLAKLVAPFYDGTALPDLVNIGQEYFAFSLPTRRDVLYQAWSELGALSADDEAYEDGVTRALDKDDWMAAAAIHVIADAAPQSFGQNGYPTHEEVNAALQRTMKTGTPLARETARRVQHQLHPSESDAAKGQTMLTTIEKVIFLKEVPFFQSMSIDQLRVLASISEEQLCRENETVFKEGAYGDALYVIVNGEIAIQRQVKRGNRTSVTRLAALGPREYFAEMSIFDNESYSADAVAIKPTELLLIRQAPLVALIKHQPELALSLLKVLSLRLRRANEQLAEKTQAKPKQLIDLYDKF